MILSGQAVFELRLKDSMVTEMRNDFEELAPGRSRRFSNSWSTAAAQENALYRVVGYVLYEATASPAEEMVISTNAAPSAEFTVAPDTVTAGQEIAFDGSGSKDTDGTVIAYRWEFGDGGKAEGVEAAHVYPEPGEFVVTLVVTDDGGRPASAEKTILVGE
jgi:PKD repeat protein